MLKDMLNDICITIDVDPDGLSGKSINRNAQTFDSFHKIKDDFSSIRQVIGRRHLYDSVNIFPCFLIGV